MIAGSLKISRLYVGLDILPGFDILRGPTTRTKSMIYVIFISVYLFALIGIGAYKSTKIKTQADFAAAGEVCLPGFWSEPCWRRGKHRLGRASEKALTNLI